MRSYPTPSVRAPHRQHSGQHLVTAVADRAFGYKTISWSLGLEESYLDLGVKKVKDEDMRAVEDECNRLIRARTPMTATVLEREDPKLAEARGNPDNVVGPIRVMEIVGVDKNLCCGTHVSNLADLQLVKLTRWETVKGFTRVHYVAGNRALAYLGELCQREREATRALKYGRWAPGVCTRCELTRAPV